MESFTLRELAQALHTQAPVDAVIRDVSTDTRHLPEGCLFVALRGKRFDGHDFVQQAVAAGAAAAVTDTQIGSSPCMVVQDTGQALLDIAGFYRRRFSIPVTAVTGSVGKTTTKEIVACVLSEKYRTLKTEKNLNNEIGLPQTLLGLTAEHGAAVVEMGMNHFGEISRMSRCAAPDIAVITNVGYSHIENLGSREGIRRAKLEILEGMAPDAPLVTNGDDPMLCTLKQELHRPVYTFSVSGSEADVTAGDIREVDGSTLFTICHGGERYPAVIPAVGEHNVKNALAAYFVGTLAGLAPQEILRGIARYQPTGMRQNIVTKNGQTVIVDCYNASPDSMRAGLNVLAGLACTGRRVAVLGDMLELGEHSEKLHAMVGEMAADAHIDALFCLGNDARHIAEHSGMDAFCTADAGSLTEKLREFLHEGDTVLFKASRGMHLETVIAGLYGDL